MSEVDDLIEGWTFFLIGFFGFAFCAGLGIAIAGIAFLSWFLIGIFILVQSFMTYQWPHRHEYIDFWRNQWTR